MDGNCATLASTPDLGYLCRYVDVALACPHTCNVCKDQETLIEQGCGSNLPGVVNIGDMVGECTCKWLKLSVAGRGHFALLCNYTSVAFHCPASCGICELKL